MNWIGIITTLLTVVNILICLLLIFVVLLQRPKNEGLGAAFGGDTASNIFGAQTTNVLANLTRWLGGLFLGICLIIAVLGTIDPTRKSAITDFVNQRATEKKAAEEQKKAEEAAKAAALKLGEKPDPTAEKPVDTTPPIQPLAPGATPAPAPGAVPTTEGLAPKPAPVPALEVAPGTTPKPQETPAAPATPAPGDKPAPAPATAPAPTPGAAAPADKPADSKPAEKPADSQPAPASAPGAPKPQ